MSYILHLIILSPTDKLSQSVSRTSGIGSRAMKAGLGPGITHRANARVAKVIHITFLYLYLHSLVIEIAR